MNETGEAKLQRMKVRRGSGKRDRRRAERHVSDKAKVYYDRYNEIWGVRITVARQRYELTMPAPGAHYALFRNGTWAGFGVTSHTPPAEVAHCLVARIAHFR